MQGIAMMISSEEELMRFLGQYRAKLFRLVGQYEARTTGGDVQVATV